jgi:hypothetical protein
MEGSPITMSSPSAGEKTCIWGIPRMSEMSSSAWCVGPFPSERNPATPPTSLTGRFPIPTSVRINSNALIVRNVARACTTGFRPLRASPAAAPTIVCSAMPTSMNLLPSTPGRFLIATRFSAVITTMFSSASAASLSTSSYVRVSTGHLTMSVSETSAAFPVP